MAVHPKEGFTLVEIMIVVAIIGLLAVIAIPNFTKAREATQQTTCINNMRQIDGAKQQWALANEMTGSETPTSAEIALFVRGGYPGCPTQGDYTISNVNTSPSCSNHGVFPGL